MELSSTFNAIYIYICIIHLYIWVLYMIYMFAYMCVSDLSIISIYLSIYLSIYHLLSIEYSYKIKLYLGIGHSVFSEYCLSRERAPFELILQSYKHF